MLLTPNLTIFILLAQLSEAFAGASLHSQIICPAIFFGLRKAFSKSVDKTLKGVNYEMALESASGHGYYDSPRLRKPGVFASHHQLRSTQRNRAGRKRGRDSQSFHHSS